MNDGRYAFGEFRGDPEAEATHPAIDYNNESGGAVCQS